MVQLNKDGHFPFEIILGETCYLRKYEDAKKLLEELGKAIKEYEELNP